MVRMRSFFLWSQNTPSHFTKSRALNQSREESKKKEHHTDKHSIVNEQERQSVPMNSDERTAKKKEVDVQRRMLEYKNE